MSLWDLDGESLAEEGQLERRARRRIGPVGGKQDAQHGSPVRKSVPCLRACTGADAPGRDLAAGLLEDGLAVRKVERREEGDERREERRVRQRRQDDERLLLERRDKEEHVEVSAFCSKRPVRGLDSDVRRTWKYPRLIDPSRRWTKRTKPHSRPSSLPPPSPARTPSPLAPLVPGGRSARPLPLLSAVRSSLSLKLQPTQPSANRLVSGKLEKLMFSPTPSPQRRSGYVRSITGPTSRSKLTTTKARTQRSSAAVEGGPVTSGGVERSCDWFRRDRERGVELERESVRWVRSSGGARGTAVDSGGLASAELEGEDGIRNGPSGRVGEPSDGGGENESDGGGRCRSEVELLLVLGGGDAGRRRAESDRSPMSASCAIRPGSSSCQAGGLKGVGVPRRGSGESDG